MINLIARKPWILIYLLFALVIAAWATFFIIARNNPAEDYRPGMELPGRTRAPSK